MTLANGGSPMFPLVVHQPASPSMPFVARCLETIDVCIWRMFVFMSVVVTVWGSVGMFVV